MSTRMSGKATMNARAASVIAALPSEGGPSLIVSDPWARSARPRAPDPGCTTRRCTAGRSHAADLEETGRRSSGDVSVEGLRKPFHGDLESLVCPAAMVAGILPVLVRDPRLRQMVAEQPVTPVQVVVVVPPGVEQDARKLAQVVETVVDVDDRVEAQPAAPHL